MEKSPKADVIIVAAGSGSRFGRAKQFAELRGMPLYLHSVQTFAKHEALRRIILVISPDDVTRIENEIFSLQHKEKITIALGGAERQDSVANGLQKLEELGSSEIVLVHDAARPFISSEIIANVITAIEAHGAALAAIPVVDTLKHSEEGFSVATIPRLNIWRAQTPQGARFEVLKKAMRSAHDNNYSATDEAELLERIGVKPFIVSGDEKNVKITYERDLNSYNK